MELKEITKRMFNQKLYYCNNESLLKEQTKYLELLYDFNLTRPGEQAKRNQM